MKFSIQGLQREQRRNQKALRELQPRNAVAKAVQFMTAGGMRAAIIRTPVDTGTWRSSHRAGYFNYRGVVFVDPGAVNPRSGERPADYAAKLHSKGAKYQVYDQVVAYEGDRLLRGGAMIISREIFG